MTFLELCCLKTKFDVGIYQRQQYCFVSSLVTELAYPVINYSKQMTSKDRRRRPPKQSGLMTRLTKLFKTKVHFHT